GEDDRVGILVLESPPGDVDLVRIVRVDGDRGALVDRVHLAELLRVPRRAAVCRTSEHDLRSNVDVVADEYRVGEVDVLRGESLTGDRALSAVRSRPISQPRLVDELTRRSLIDQ